MRLPDGGRADGFVAKLRVNFVDAFARFLLDDSPGDGRIEGLDVLPKLFQFPAVACREQIRAAGHDLAYFHVGGAEVFQGRPEFDGRKAVGVEIVLGKNGEHFRIAVLIAGLKRLQLLRQKPFQLRAHLYRALL